MNLNMKAISNDFVQDAYNKIALRWHKDHNSDDWWIEGTNNFISLLPRGAKVLDVGCGGGTKSQYLHERGMKVFGIDFSKKMIEIARRHLPTGTFAVVSAEHVDILHEKFDGVFMQAVLLHIKRDKAQDIINKMADVLNPNGYLYIAVKDKKPGRGDEEVITKAGSGYSYRMFFSYYNTQEIKQMMIAAGLTPCYETAKFSGRSNWIQVIGKKNA